MGEKDSLMDRLRTFARIYSKLLLLLNLTEKQNLQWNKKISEDQQERRRESLLMDHLRVFNEELQRLRHTYYILTSVLRKKKHWEKKVGKQTKHGKWSTNTNIQIWHLIS